MYHQHLQYNLLLAHLDGTALLSNSAIITLYVRRQQMNVIKKLEGHWYSPETRVTILNNVSLDKHSGNLIDYFKKVY